MQPRGAFGERLVISCMKTLNFFQHTSLMPLADRFKRLRLPAEQHSLRHVGSNLHAFCYLPSPFPSLCHGRCYLDLIQFD
jgi:hypothetical protein